jgi:hypothetical protein
MSRGRRKRLFLPEPAMMHRFALYAIELLIDRIKAT